MGFQQIQAPTLRELFVDQVIGMIFSGELRVGDRLPSERELSEQMHISRSMVHTISTSCAPSPTGCARPSPRGRASLPTRGGCASLTRPSPS